MTIGITRRDMPFYSNCSSPFAIMGDRSPHSLLEPTYPAYTNMTICRAFIVWLHCGKKNKFDDVCNYYHNLEPLEEKLPANMRASSRHHEFNMFTNQPLKTSYINHHFPSLYFQSLNKQNINKVEALTNEKCVFKLEGVDDIRRQERTAKNEILLASRMIRNYCKSHSKILRRFLDEFKEYTRICELNTSVGNVVFYIKRKLIEEELQLNINFPKDFSFLNSSNETRDISDVINIDTDMPSEIRIVSNDAKKANKQTSPDISTNNVLTQSIDKMATSNTIKYPDLNENSTEELVDNSKGDNMFNFAKIPENGSNSWIVGSLIANMQHENIKGQDLSNSQCIMTEMSKLRKI